MTADVQTCYVHDDRRAGVRCQRCDRPICPTCMTQAAVGFHCPSCLRGGRQQVVMVRQIGAGMAAPVTTVLVAVNVAVYALSAAPEGLARPSFAFQVDWALLGIGRTAGQLVGVAEGEWYRLITGGFLHGGLLHLAFNMYVLWILGRQFEPAIGRASFAVVYVASMLAGDLGVMVLDPTALTVGASGAVFGLFGYAVVNQLARGINPMQTGIGGIVVLNLLFTFIVPGISVGGHVGGLLGGAIASMLHQVVPSRLRLPPTIGVVLVAAFGLACGVGAIVQAGA